MRHSRQPCVRLYLRSERHQRQLDDVSRAPYLVIYSSRVLSFMVDYLTLQGFSNI
jgi:hypothetical protein